MKRLHKTEVVQEARMMKHSFLGRRKTNRQVCLALNSNLEARPETDTDDAGFIPLPQGLGRLSEAQ